MQPISEITTLYEVSEPAGKNRLVIRMIERPFPNPEPGRKMYDFHSLLWEMQAGDDWAERVVITQDDFERGSRRRFVNDLHSLDSTAGTAIIQVGEEQTRDEHGCTKVEYTWREWDLIGNRQLRVLRVCVDPFEPYPHIGNDKR